VGSVVLTVLSLTIVPALLSYYPRNVSRFSPLSRLDLPAFFERLSRYSIRNARKMILFWGGVTAVFAIFSVQLVVDSNPVLYFKDGFWFRDAVNFVEERGSGGAVYEIVVRGKGEDSIKTVEYMRDLDKLTQYLAKDAPGDFRNVYSLSTILRNINRSMHGDDPAYHVLPEDDATVAQYLLLYSLSVPVGQDINDRMNIDNSATRVTIVRPIVSTRDGRRNMDAIQAWADQNLTNVKAEFTGRDVLYTNMGNNITDSLIKSLGFDVLTILPLLILMFRTVTAGIVSVFVNVGPLVIVLGLMGLLGITLDVGTLMVAALGLGIAVDDTVHLLAHYFKNRRAGEPAGEAAVKTMRHVGAPATLTTLTLTIGFLVFLGAEFEPNFFFGLLISVVVALALLADLTLAPALLNLIDGFRDAKRAAREPQSPIDLVKAS
jgi:predicted RND superfamily exporter protein